MRKATRFEQHGVHVQRSRTDEWRASRGARSQRVRLITYGSRPDIALPANVIPETLKLTSFSTGGPFLIYAPCLKPPRMAPSS